MDRRRGNCRRERRRRGRGLLLHRPVLERPPLRIILSTRTAADVAHICRCIARDNPPRAASFFAELRETVQRISDMPHGFRLVPRYERHGIRRRSWKGDGILYSVLPDRIFVYRSVVTGPRPGHDHDRALGLR